MSKSASDGSFPCLRPGSLAFFDTFAGNIPVKVKSIAGIPPGSAPRRPSSSIKVTFEVTATGRGYQKGEELTRSAIWVYPRKAHYYGPCGIGRIAYHTVSDAPEEGD